MHRLLILSRHARDYHRLVDAARLPDLEVTSTSDPADAAPHAGDYDLAFGEPSLLRQVLPAMTSMRWTQATWAGVEPLLDPALRRDYTLTNARGVFGGLMSEYVFAYLLAHERRIFEKQASQGAGRWDTARPGTLRGKQIGLLGVGTIGAAIARTAKHFGMIVKGYTRASEDSPDVDAWFHGRMDGQRVAFALDLDYLVSIMPATRETRHLVDAALLRTLPARAVFVNPGRGGIVDEPALAAALQEGRLAGGRARRLPGGAAAARARLLADAESPHHIAHRGAQRPARHRAGVHRQLPPPAARRAAAAPGQFRVGVLKSKLDN